MLDQNFYTTKELAHYLNVDDQFIRRMIRKGQIKVLQFFKKGSIRIAREEVERLILENTK